MWDRAAVAVHVFGYLLSFASTIEDLRTQTSWSFKGNELDRVGGELVAHLLSEPANA